MPGGVAPRRGSLRSELDRLLRVAELSARGADVDDVVMSARAELIGLFGLDECVYQAERSGPELPHLGNRGALEGACSVAWGDFVLPTGGVEVPVRDAAASSAGSCSTRPRRRVRHSRSDSSPSPSPTSSASPWRASPPEFLTTVGRKSVPWRRFPYQQLCRDSGADGVVATVDVDDLAGGRRGRGRRTGRRTRRRRARGP